MNLNSLNEISILIKGAGELASGAAARLWRAGFPVVMTELEQPLSIRRTVCFSEAIYCHETIVEEIRAARVTSTAEIKIKWKEGVLPILVDPSAEIASQLHPAVVIDARIAKINLSTHLDEAGFVVGLGPGFSVGQNVHAVIETNRGHFLGRVLWQGCAEPDTRIPGEMKGIRSERVIYSPNEGIFTPTHEIGDTVIPGERIGTVDQTPIITPIGGILRGLIHPGIYLPSPIKMADVDPRMNSDYCAYISDKSLAIGGGVLEAVMTYLHRLTLSI